MTSKNMRFALGSSASLLLLAACSGGGSPTNGAGVPQLSQSSLGVHQSASSFQTINDLTGRVGLPRGFHGLVHGIPLASPGWMSEEAKTTAKVYVSDLAQNAVFVYNAKNPTSPIGTITSGLSVPLGSVTDSKGNLYVTSLGTNSVPVYAPGKTTPFKTYTNGLNGPIGVAVGKDGTVYVSEYSGGAVVEYAEGKTSPARTLSVPNAEGVALDSKNNLYVSYSDPNSGLGEVVKFAPKATTGTNLGITVNAAGDVKLNKANDLLLEDQIAQTVNFYKPGATSPYGSISVPGADTYKMALNSTEKLLYVATVGPAVDIFDAKPNGAPAGAITNGLEEASGVSLSPAPPN